MSVTKVQASALATTKRNEKPTKLLRARPAGKKLSDIALLKKAIKHYPKTLARLAK